MTLQDLKNEWEDTKEFHRHINELFKSLVNEYPILKEHRDFVEANVYGFGERSFYWLWKILLDDLSDSPNLLEIGVFRGQILSLWRILKPDANIFGVSPLDNSGGLWDSDYEEDIRNIHNNFRLRQPIIFKGLSQDINIIQEVQNKWYNVVYIDGGHDYETVMNDLINYASQVKTGGYLVIDDANCDMNMEFGYFQGIQSVTDAKIKYMSTTDEKWEFIGSVVHLAIYKKS